jgi:hypothetical protein
MAPTDITNGYRWIQMDIADRYYGSIVPLTETVPFEMSGFGEVVGLDGLGRE